MLLRIFGTFVAAAALVAASVSDMTPIPPSAIGRFPTKAILANVTAPVRNFVTNVYNCSTLPGVNLELDHDKWVALPADVLRDAEGKGLWASCGRAIDIWVGDKNVIRNVRIIGAVTLDFQDKMSVSLPVWRNFIEQSQNQTHDYRPWRFLVGWESVEWVDDNYHPPSGQI